METIQLSESHQRRLETLLHIVEMRLGELKVELNRQTPPITYHLEPPLSEDQQTILSHQIDAIRDEIAQLMRKYGLSVRHLPWSQRLNALSSSLWVDLQDSRSDQMKGYGAFTPDEHPADYDQDISQLLSLIGTIQTLSILE